MKQFLRENFVLVIGITLPIIMIIIFALATIIPGYFVKPPQYNFIFSTPIYNYGNNGFSFNVINGKLKTQFSCDNTCTNQLNTLTPELYIFDVTTRQTKKIPLNLPDINKIPKPFVINIKIPELDNVTIDPSPRAPDGYVFSTNHDNSGLITDLFYGSRYAQSSISKDGNTIAITSDSGNNNFQYAKFIGWITNNKGN